MRDASLYAKRFAELSEQIKTLESSKKHNDSEYSSYDSVDSDLFVSWKVSARHLISIVCGIESEHYKQFVECEKPKPYRDTYGEFREVKSVFVSAKEDFEGGYLDNFKTLVQAEVFGSELEQASELLANGYKSAAAVISGVVLETALRQLCSKSKIASGKLDRMNADLAKAGAYNVLTQKRITALAGIRNSAAHGNTGDFTEDDVKEMISYTERFLEEKL